MYATERIRELLATDECLHDTCRDLASQAANGRSREGANDHLARRLAELVEDILIPRSVTIHSITRGLVKELLWEVNWNEIAGDYIDELDSSEFDDDEEEGGDAKTY